MTNNFGYLLQSYLTDYIIGERNYSINTQQSYATVFFLLITFLKERYDINSNDIKMDFITRDIIIEYLDWLEKERDASIPTQSQRLAGIKSFYEYVQIKEPSLFYTCSSILSIKNKQGPTKIITYFLEDEIKIIINYLNKRNDLKRLTLLCVLYETGARVTELVNIRLDDLSLYNKATIKLHGKGKKTRVVPISQELVTLINLYLKEQYTNYGGGYLFYSNQRRPYSRKTINYTINTLVAKLRKIYPNKFKSNYSPHSFRHSKGTHLYNNGTPLMYIRDFLGHESVTTTEIYAKPYADKAREYIINNAEKIEIKKQYSDKQKEELEQWLKNVMK